MTSTSTAHDLELDDVFVGRQPILDRRLRTAGYELLFRPGSGASTAGVVDGDAATAKVVSNAIAEIGLDQLVGEHRAYVNVTRRFLVEPGLLECLPPDRTVLEIVEDVQPDAEVVLGIKELKARGYTIALDDFVPGGRTAPLRDAVDIVKYDRRSQPDPTLASEIALDRAAGRQVVVERIETQEDHQAAVAAGADLVQGYFFARPTVVESSTIPANTAALLRLVTAINSPTATMEQIVDLITQDVAMSVKILRVVNSASVGLSRRVDSIQHAAVLVGRDRLRSWASLVMMASIDGQPEALIAMALTRAKFCELLAVRRGIDAPVTAFTVGMLSLLPAMTASPMNKVIDQVGVSDEIHGALLRRAGAYGELLDLAVAVEDVYRFDVVTDPDVVSSHREAMRWSLSVTETNAA